MNATAASLTDLHGIAIPLERVRATGRLAGLMLELTVEQQYRNTTRDAIEAVYTFPLPLHAVLLSLELELDGRRQVARVVEKRAAARAYEQAIDDGDSAALLEDHGNGLYTVNLANLKPGETAVLRYRYGQLLSACDGYLRVQVPTAIAPRYGNAGDAGLTGAAVPGFDVLVDYPFDLSLQLEGLRDAGGVRSPSHRVTVTANEAGLAVALAGRKALDRDLVIEIAQAALPRTAQLAREDEGRVTVLASPILPVDSTEQRPLRLKILLDCSGSMGGARIAAARRALLAILDRVGRDDRLALARFGSRYERVSEGLEPMDAATRDALALLVRGFDADLGGTEMASALQEMLAIPVPRGERADVVLVTDGEIHAVDALVDVAARGGHRLFVVAIGAAPNEALARRVSERSGGACEFVGDDEDAEGAILRMVMRLRAAPRSIERVEWPEGTVPEWTTPLPAAVFPGETIHLFAGFGSQPAGTVRVTLRTADGIAQQLQVPLATHTDSADLLPRLAAARRLPTLPKAEALALAVAKQLTSDQTSLVLVIEREGDDKIVGVPTTQVVPQMLSIVESKRAVESIADHVFAPAASAPKRLREPGAAWSGGDAMSGFLLRAESKRSASRLPPLPWDVLLAEVSTHLRGGGSLPRSLADLEALLAGRWPALLEAIREAIADEGLEEAGALDALLATLARRSGAALAPELAALRDHPVLTQRDQRALRQWAKGLVR
jgi:Ca-activated chloride channel homolog